MLAPSTDLTRSIQLRPHRYCLMVLADGAMHELPASGRVTIGRAHDCTISINSTEVSRQHAAIEINGDRMWVEDLGSKNGTCVRGAFVTPGGLVGISAGDAIELGSLIVLLQYLPEVGDPPMLALIRVVDQLADNVRELRHMMERALSGATPDAASEDTGPRALVDDDPDRARTLEALDRCHGNQTRAARMLGIARSTLLKRLDLYQVPRPRK